MSLEEYQEAHRQLMLAACAEWADRVDEAGLKFALDSLVKTLHNSVSRGADSATNALLGQLSGAFFVSRADPSSSTLHSQPDRARNQHK